MGFADGKVTRRVNSTMRAREGWRGTGDHLARPIVSIESEKHDLAEAMAAPRPRSRVRPLSKEYAQIEPVAAAAREVAGCVPSLRC